MAKIYQHLNIRERAMIEMQLEMGMRPGSIAGHLNRAPSTISREIHRNGWRRPTIVPRPGKKLVAGGTTAIVPSIARGASLRFRGWRASWCRALRFGF